MKKIKSVLVAIIGVVVFGLVLISVILVLRKNKTEELDKIEEAIVATTVATSESITQFEIIENETEEYLEEIISPTRTTIDTPEANTEHKVNKAVNNGKYLRLSDYPNTIIVNYCEGYTYNQILNTLFQGDYLDGRPVLLDSVTYDREDGTVLNITISNGYGNPVNYEIENISEDNSENWKDKIPSEYAVLYSNDIGYVNGVE